MAKDSRSLAQTEADEAAAIRESYKTATTPVEETLDDDVEPVSALEVQGDIPGLDDNSEPEHAPSWDEARAIADEKPVGADPGEASKEGSDPAYPHAAAFRDGEPAGPRTSEVQVRPAGPNATRTKPESWDEVDEAVDESFPASDPAAKY